MTSKGYTFIEIMVVMTITGLIFGLGYAGFREFARRQLVTSAARSIKADLRLAQEQSIAGKKPEDCTGSLDGYKFTFRAGPPPSYTVAASCSSGDVVIKEVTLAETIEVTVPAVNPIIFKPIGVGTNIPDGETQTITVSVAGGNYPLQLTIGSSGDIQ